MYPRALRVRLLSVVVVLLSASFAGAATTELRVFFDSDHNALTGCTVGGMSGVEQVLVTQVTDSGSSARVTRTFRQLCTGSGLGPITDDDATGWDARFQTGSGELTFETRIPVRAFGPDGISRTMRLGFEANRPPATHAALVDVDGSDVVIHEAAVRRRALRTAGSARTITLDGNLADWTGIDPVIHGMASEGTRDLRLLRVFTWEGEEFLYFAVIARLSSDAPFADDDVYHRPEGQGLSVAGPGVLANDGDPLGEDLDAEIVTEPARGSLALNEEEGGFTYSPDNPQANGTDSFEYKVRAGTRDSNVARVQIAVGDAIHNEPPSFTAGGNITVPESSGLYQESWATGISPGSGETQAVHFTVTNDNNYLFSQQPTLAADGTLRFVPFLRRDGSAVVTVRLTDSEGASSAPATFTIVVLNLNDAPAFSVGPNPVVAEDAGPQTVQPWATAITPGGVDESGQSVFFTVVGNSKPSLFSVGPAVSPAGALTYTPAANANGTATIKLRLSDNGSPAASSAPRQFTITITPVNDAPSFTAGASSIVVLDAAGPHITGWATAVSPGPSNEAGQALSFIVSNDNPALFTAAPSIAPNGTLTFTPAAGHGVATVTVRLQDNGGVANGGLDTSATTTFGITVENVPVITSAAITTFTVGQPGSFTVTTSARPTASVEQSGVLPAGVTFAGGTLSGTPAASTGGTYPISFRATNGRGSSPVQNFTLVVNEAPGITSANAASFVRGVLGSFTVTTSGHPHPSIALAGAAVPADLTFTDHGDGTATLSGKANVTVASYAGFTLTASNGTGSNAAQSFTINVNSVVYPMPGSQSQPPVLCAGCLGSNASGQLNDGLPTYPYGSPIASHVGRYVDSQTTANYQNLGFRTARARTIRTFSQANGQAPPRVYIQIGNAVGAYALDTFFSTKLPAGPVSVGGVKTGSPVGGFGRSPLEKITMWDGFFYPEALASGWYTPVIDQQDPMAKGGPFDVDDRGYIYGSWPTFGWGIARDDGRTDATHFPKVVQMVYSIAGIDQTQYPNTQADPSGVTPNSILAIPSGGRYYAVIAGSSNSSAVFDVTVPAAPLYLAKYPGTSKAILRYDRSDAHQRVAYVDATRNLQVYSYDALVSGGAPMASEAKSDGGFRDVAIDDAGNIWAIESTRLVKLTPSGGGFVTTSYPSPFGSSFGSMSVLAVGAGHLAVAGVTTAGTVAEDVRLATIGAGAPVEVPLGGFFKNYYFGGAPGFAEPGPYTQPFDLHLISWNGKTYLMNSAEGLGDVFEIQTP